MLSLLAFGVAAALSQKASTPAYGPEVTVYNAGFGIIKDVRTLDLKEGRQTVKVTDVASQIDPTTVGLRSLTFPNGIDLLEQNYQYDLISPTAILAKSVGGRIRLTRAFGNKMDVLEGTLISAPYSVVAGGDGSSMQTYNGLVLKTDDGRIVLNPIGEVEVTSVPKGLISQPTLLWDLASHNAGANKVELSYKTGGLSWTADYVLTLDDASRKGDLQGWVTLNNSSGASYNNAHLKLLAGQVNVVQPRNTRGFAGGFGGAAMARDAAPMQEEQLFEYHLYTLPRPSTIHDKEIKQLSLLKGEGVPYEKRLVIDSLRDWGVYYPSQNEIGGGTIHAQARIEFKNSTQNGLGMALPAGRVRMYQRDKSGSLQLIGEDQIQHTPKDETLSLIAGNAFDVVSNRKRTNYEAISSNVVRETFSISIRNRKETAEDVDLLERHWGDWSVTNPSDPFEKADANTMRFRLHLKPNEEKEVTYTITTKW